MKFILQVIIYLILTYLSLSQEAEGQTISKKIEYTCRYNNMFDRGVGFKNYHASLIIHGDKSLYTMKADAENKQDSHVVMVDLEPDSLFTVFKDLESNSLIFEINDMNQKEVYYADTLYPMHWEFISEKKFISNIECEKARTVFKGRSYTVWYAPGIPIMNGPWKLGGLPGLIMEAYDDEENWHIQFVSQQNITPIEFDPYDKLLHGNVPGYIEYGNEVKKIFKRVSQYLASQQTGNCLSCQTKSTLKLHTWEWVD